MLSTDTALEVRTCGTALLDSHLHQLADTLLVEHLERIDVQDLLLQIRGEEAGDIVTAIAEGHLREVVRTEAEVLSMTGDEVCGQCGTRDLNHRTHLERHLHTLVCEELIRRLVDHLLLLLQLRLDTYQRHHDLGTRVKALLLQLAGSTEDGTRLHGRDLRERIAETASTQTQHRVVLRQRVDTVLDEADAHTHVRSHDLLTAQIVRYKLVERRVEQADIHRLAVHTLQDAVEVLTLIGQ